MGLNDRWNSSVGGDSHKVKFVELVQFGFCNSFGRRAQRVRILLDLATRRLLNKKNKKNLDMLPTMFGGDWMHATMVGLAKLGLSVHQALVGNI